MTEEKTPKPYKVSVVDRQTGGARPRAADTVTDSDTDTSLDGEPPEAGSDADSPDRLAAASK
ncbi:MAG: hypothetical protein ACRDWB_10705, partial [Acidimicrobiales bacterium]